MNTAYEDGKCIYVCENSVLKVEMETDHKIMYHLTLFPASDHGSICQISSQSSSILYSVNSLMK